ncbi:cyclin-dependent kinase 2-interacting protein-like [Sycon ciliatum]|uniref:cyclin-dependent kinase 2-interacting protein-like n=1 Tax=Sycon ciliatum TaxID=27933 RepID=UPI0020ACCD0C|eukprot:scpid89081/ scgid18480/ 
MTHAKPDDLTLRRLRECCTQLHSCLLIWRETKASGLRTATTIVNASLAHCSVSITALQALNDSVQTLCNCVKTISSLTGNVQAVHRLVCKRSSQLGHVEQPLFHTLSSLNFVCHFEQILSAYSQELCLCQLLANNVQSNDAQAQYSEDKDTLMTYLSAWKHEIYVTEQTRLLLEALLVETDLR